MSKSPVSTRRQSFMLHRKRSQAPWLFTGCAMVMLGIPIGTYRLDRSWRGEIDPIAADIPVNCTDPFKETRSEALLKAAFREPKVVETLNVQLGPAKIAGAAGSDSEISPASMAKAQKIYGERCASCHGVKGNGDGPGAFAIKPKPRDYTDAEWQKTVTDEELAKAIVKGGAAVGKSYMMPANYDLKSKPEVAAGLVLIVRSFAQR